MDKLKEYNNTMSSKWSETATLNNAELLFGMAVTVDEKREVMVFWDNARGNDSMIDTLKQVVRMLEANRGKNFSEKNNK